MLPHSLRPLLFLGYFVGPPPSSTLTLTRSPPTIHQPPPQSCSHQGAPRSTPASISLVHTVTRATRACYLLTITPQPHPISLRPPERERESLMDWYEWLRRAGLGEDLAAEYALLFESNELDAADVGHLDHAFLATMGVAVAKHRLEILKLAKKESSTSIAITVLPWRATRLVAAAAQRSARSVAGCLRSAAHWNRRAAVAPRPLALCHQRGGFGAAVGRPKSAPKAADGRGTTMKLAALLTRFSKPVLTLTTSSRGKGTKNGAVTRRATAIAAGCFTGRETYSDYDADDDEEDGEDEGETDEEDPETPWESMFQDLNPT